MKNRNKRRAACCVISDADTPNDEIQKRLNDKSVLYYERVFSNGSSSHFYFNPRHTGLVKKVFPFGSVSLSRFTIDKKRKTIFFKSSNL